ncbi:unnamed protein product [Rotaria magnacalcarata]|uniref:Glucosamine/galactosamine-6-phosphate isomerase domain-containing protein n=3 Tax=Rotaria magnacalcarata TaxID=392030 RepID=A0A816V9W9_9BILA|nr:unnamed protein product [Rotaria magnacalcarata]CAF2117374.1 unnamed protein product [Rotaria magnacalcarata]CAF3853172.1 unnamed protein product [Rotaria magnacalcarata]
MLSYLLVRLILNKLSKSQIITIGLSGGSLVDLHASMLPRLRLPWARLKFFFVDQRFVPFTSDDSTYRNYQSKLFRQLPLTENNIIKIDANLEIVEEYAKDYQNKLQEALNGEDKARRLALFLSR